MESEQREVNRLRDFHQFWQLDPSFFFKETDFPSEHALEKSWDLESEAVGLSSDLDLTSYMKPGKSLEQLWTSDSSSLFWRLIS